MRVDLQPFVTAEQAWEALLDQAGDADGESLDLVEHGLQTAEGLERAGAGDELIVAGLLHDLGDGRVSAAEHASYAASLVRPLFGERVAWLIAAHADAKRYLCATDPGYWNSLSPISQRTLIEQGDVMSGEEAVAWAQHPWAQDAALLRRCDDGGKNGAYAVPNRERFRDLLQRMALR
jgi:gamma-butyrobetaine dioxygenase